LYPFTLKKGSNFHGIVFGAKSPRAVEKFLTIAWKRNGTNGEANFDIDQDQKKSQLNIFTTKKLTKIEGFHQSIEEKLRTARQLTNAELFLFTLDMGHPPKHTGDYLRELKRRKTINYEGRGPKITFDALMDRNNSTVMIKWIAI
jgi:hypothetical protein